jgi:hypothetical protein
MARSGGELEMAAIAFRHAFGVRRISMLQIDAVVSAKLGETRGRGRSQPLAFNRQVCNVFGQSLWPLVDDGDWPLLQSSRSLDRLLFHTED